MTPAVDLLGDGWHGTMNYAGFTRQVWCWLAAAGLPRDVPGPSRRGAGHLRPAGRGLPSGVSRPDPLALRSITSWNILGSHDTARIRTVVGSHERQVAALAMAVGLPGVPMVFAGDEIGATGRWGEESRTPFPWDDPSSWDQRMLEAYRTLLGLRSSSDALAVGGLRWLHVSADCLGFVREVHDEGILVVVARNQSETVRIPLSDLGGDSLSSLFGFEAEIVAGQVCHQCPVSRRWRVASGGYVAMAERGTGQRGQGL